MSASDWFNLTIAIMSIGYIIIAVAYFVFDRGDEEV